VERRGGGVGLRARGLAGDLLGVGVLLLPLCREGPGLAFLEGDLLADLFGVGVLLLPLCREGPGLAFLEGDLPLDDGVRLPDLLWLLDRAGVRVSCLPREGAGALLPLWPLGGLGRAPGPAFHAGFARVLPLFPDRADPGLAFRADDLPRAGEFGGGLVPVLGLEFRAGDLPRAGLLPVLELGLVFRAGNLPREGALLALRRLGPGDGPLEPARLNDLAPRPL